MPNKSTIAAAKRDKAQGKSAGTQAGEFVHAEIDRIRKGQTGARNTKQAIAIGLNEARRAGVDLKAPAKGKVSEKSRKSSESAYRKGQNHEPISPKRSRTSEKTMKKEGHEAASPRALSKQASTAAQKRTSSPHKNKLGVKNTLVNNINAKKKAGTSHSKKNSTVSKKSYDNMEHDWK